MKKISLYMAVLLLSGCSFNAIEMAAEPTVQKFDLSDKESDGVINARDICPESFSGAAVANDGCGTESVEEVRRTLLVNFQTDSAKVNPRFYPEIQGLADFMKEHATVAVTIEGHTSIRGDAAYNKRLSLRRAKAIKSILVKKYNIADERIKPVGFGSEQLLLEGDDEYVHAKNRRIVAEIFSEKRIADMKWTIYSVDERVQ